MDELTREFLIESQEGLDRMERCLTDLEERPDDAALIADIFRSVHTIKGTTGFLGFKRLEKLAHTGENLLGMVREGKLEATPAIITGLLELMDILRAILKNIEADGSEGESSNDGTIIANLEQLQSPAKAPQAKEADSAHAESIQAHAVGKQAGSAETGGAAVAEPPVASAPAPAAPVSSVASASPTSAPPPKLSAAAAPATGPEAPEAEAGRTKAASTTSAAESTLRVDVALLNRMMNLVGELVLTRNQVLQATSADPKMTLLSRRLDMVTADLRESVMRARMQPVSNVFSKMPRMVRDLAQMLHRRVRLQMEGQETELDKSLLEAIKDPLTHAIRNSLDHGIEPPDVREANGKDPEGTLRLRALQEGSHVIIEVSDDGAGIGVERVRAKAIERGLISADRAALLSERELLQLIFLPGFSTAAAVTNVSGRGVGMDVVRTTSRRSAARSKSTRAPARAPRCVCASPSLWPLSLR